MVSNLSNLPGREGGYHRLQSTRTSHTPTLLTLAECICESAPNLTEHVLRDDAPAHLQEGTP